MVEPRARKLKRVIIREEFVVLTGNYVRAVLLHQLEFRQKCAFDIDSYLLEEGERLRQEGIESPILPANGWFYKKAAELAAETMLELDETTIRRHLKFFIERGWVDERRNPSRKWDRTMQYRLNLVRIKADLEARNYQLEGWVFEHPVKPLASTTGNVQLGSGRVPDRSGETPDRSSKTPPGSGDLPEQYQNTFIKHIHQHTPDRTETGVCRTKSKFSAEEINRYVEECARSGQQIRGGLAVWLEETGKGDHHIAAFLEREKMMNIEAREPKRWRHAHDCPGCFGSQMEIVAGKGARPCTYFQGSDSGKVTLSAR